MSDAARDMRAHLRAHVEFFDELGIAGFSRDPAWMGQGPEALGLVVPIQPIEVAAAQSARPNASPIAHGLRASCRSRSPYDVYSAARASATPNASRWSGGRRRSVVTFCIGVCT